MSNIEVQPNREYILAGDISASMTTVDAKCGGNTRYKYMLEKFKSFIKTAEDYDPHGPTVLLFGENVHVYEDTTLDKVSARFDNVNFEGFTNLHLAIDKAYELHREKKSELAGERKVHPGTSLLVFTDGEPSNRAAVERSIVRIANEIDREDEFTITFLTVGTLDRDLKTYLDGLHDTLEDKLTRDYDIFHAQPLEETSFLSTLTLAANH